MCVFQTYADDQLMPMGFATAQGSKTSIQIDTLIHFVGLLLDKLSWAWVWTMDWIWAI